MVTPFLNFSGRCGEAIDFYEKVFNGQNKKVMRFKDAPPNPDFPITAETENLVLHAEMEICGTKVNFSDTEEGTVSGNMISLAVDFPSEDEVQHVYNMLSEGGEVLMELSPQFFSPLYAWVKDKFGIGWQIICRKG